MSRLVVLGDLNLDVHATHPGDLPPGSESHSSVWASPGGSAGTFARVAAREGADVLFLGSVGADAIGDLLIRSLEEAGVRALVARDRRPTGTILALEHGTEQTMICSRGANDGLTEYAVDETFFDGADHLHISGYAFLSPSQGRAALRAMEIARARRISIAVDPPPANLIEAFGASAFLTAVGEGTWLFTNLSEGRTLTEREEADAICNALSEFSQAGALTLGPDGALAWRGPERDRQIPPDRVSGDTTGAGDAFAAAFTVALLGGKSLEAAAQRGGEVAVAHIRDGRARTHV
jgi:ribokinase